jgi:hypothetical protein
LPKFVAEARRLFTAEEITDHLARGAPAHRRGRICR